MPSALRRRGYWLGPSASGAGEQNRADASAINASWRKSRKIIPHPFRAAEIQHAPESRSASRNERVSAHLAAGNNTLVQQRKQSSAGILLGMHVSLLKAPQNYWRTFTGSCQAARLKAQMRIAQRHLCNRGAILITAFRPAANNLTHITTIRPPGSVPSMNSVKLLRC